MICDECSGALLRATQHLLLVLLVLPGLLSAQDETSTDEELDLLLADVDAMLWELGVEPEPAPAAPVAAEPVVSPWQWYPALEAGFGYTDNALLAQRPLDSNLVRGSASLFVTRMDDLSELQFYALAEGTRYGQEEVPDETLALLDLRALYYGSLFGCLAEGSYSYSQSIFDASLTADIPVGALVRGQSLAGAGGVLLLLPGEVLLEVLLGGQRVTYAQVDEDYEALSGELRFQRTWGKWLQASLEFEAERRAFDDRPARQPDRQVLAGQTLRLDVYALGADITWYIDTARRWSLRWEAELTRTEDERGGYDRSWTYENALMLRYRPRPWEFFAQVSHRQRTYDDRQLSATTAVAEEQETLVWKLGIERALGQDWELALQASYEDYESNQDGDSYQARSLISRLTRNF